MPRFNLEDYITVQARVNQFWSDHPEGRIITTLMSLPDDFTTCRYRAEVYRDAVDARPAATGWAVEHAGGGGANQTSHEENCETSAIGRALANLGYATSQRDRPSREEMRKVERDMPDARPHEPAVPAAAPTRATNPASAGSTTQITTNQLKRIKATANTLGWDSDAGRQVLQARYNKTSSTELTIDEASDLIRYMDEQMPVAQPALS